MYTERDIALYFDMFQERNLASFHLLRQRLLSYFRWTNNNQVHPASDVIEHVETRHEAIKSEQKETIELEQKGTIKLDQQETINV